MSNCATSMFCLEVWRQRRGRLAEGVHYRLIGVGQPSAQRSHALAGADGRTSADVLASGEAQRVRNGITGGQAMPPQSPENPLESTPGATSPADGLRTATATPLCVGSSPHHIRPKISLNAINQKGWPAVAACTESDWAHRHASGRGSGSLLRPTGAPAWPPTCALPPSSAKHIRHLFGAHRLAQTVCRHERLLQMMHATSASTYRHPLVGPRVSVRRLRDVALV